LIRGRQSALAGSHFCQPIAEEVKPVRLPQTP